MVFNSASFLFMFLPAAVILERAVPGRAAKNALLCLLSAVFYAFGGLAQVPVLLLAAMWNYLLGRLLAREVGRRKLWCCAAVLGDLGLLCVYKYLDFLLSALGLPGLSRALPVPLGISFFTFHAVSYAVDVYRDPALAEKNFGRFFLYLAFFPRLLAGPIVRWKEGRGQLCERTVTAEDTAAGLRRFVRGMAKKLLLAESAAAVVNAVYALDGASLSSGLAWLGAVGYCLQIYYDFSGYSDMAIGLGRLFGFTFPENFDHPYASLSLSEFWRRWHMTLNRWFQDYLYFPLGGSRKGQARTVLNKLIVFFATGLWHGAGWTFILWGLWHGVLVSAEGLVKKPLERQSRRGVGRALLRLYTLLAVLLGFVMFRASDLAQGWLMLSRLFSFTPAGLAAQLVCRSVLTPGRIGALLLGAVFSLPAGPALRRLAAEKLGEGSPALELAGDALALAGLFLCVLAMSGGGFSPFIYQQF